MKKKILNALVIILALASVIANFYQPLKYEYDESDNVELTINIRKPEFQPLFISKRRGITEMINGKFSVTKKQDTIKINTIFFKIIKLSGLLGHGLKKATPCFDPKDNTIKIYVEVSLLSDEEEITLDINKYNEDIQKAFCIREDKPRKIITVAYYDLDEEIEKILKKIENKDSLSVEDNDKLRKFYLDKKKGSICNFNAIYE